MKTTTRKGFYGWVAKTDIPLNGDGTRILRFSTMKSNTGLLVTSASTMTIEGSLETTKIGVGVTAGGDYHNTVQAVSCKRATEKAVLEAHEAALAAVDDILADLRGDEND